jgi:hypothetical protein
MKLIDKRTDKKPASDCHLCVTVKQDGRLTYDFIDVDWDICFLFQYESLVSDLLEYYNWGTDQVKRITLYSGSMDRKTLSEVIEEKSNVSLDDSLRNFLTQHNQAHPPCPRQVALGWGHPHE